MEGRKVDDKVMELIEKARAAGKPAETRSSVSVRRRSTSSLHNIIKTKEQADAFMAALKALF